MSILTPNPIGDFVWQKAWQFPSFRRKFILGIILVLILLLTFPYFFQTIQQHSGPVLNDWVLNQLPAQDVSLGIFLSIWATALLLLIRARRSPAIFMMFIYSYLIVSLSRMISINLVPLDPPVGLIPLIDPLSNAFYGKTFITKDLFYSGHTSTIFLMFLCLRRRWDRLFAFVGTLIVGSLLLVQHVHYTIDVVGAFVFTYPLYWLGKKFALSGWNTLTLEDNKVQNASPN
ncbi:phosphatase PAP2-related protein [Spirosoma sp.]|uniref:phosphatase PAP2-related protein n=1 Tax=Spirosoma sp. TaxID=1899569 RepID=UPI002630D776|nr:phosphatase PAP2-related protein [Spirosoma sp.]MCX6216743.1 phosphatase PAP2-related protein [Spirosoma sp.]